MKKRFTLVELLLVIGCFVLMSVLVGIGCDSSSGSSGSSGSSKSGPRERARRISCGNNLNQIGKALMQYAQDNSEKMPSGQMNTEFNDKTLGNGGKYTRDAAGVGAAMDALRFGEYLFDSNVYVCPSSTASAEKDADKGLKIRAEGGTLSYAYSYVAGGSYTDSAISGDLTHIGNPNKNANHDNFGNLLFFDGHVTGYNGAGWCSEENTGYTEFNDSGMTRRNALPPNTICK